VTALALLVLLSDPFAAPPFPAGIAGTYTQTRPDASCALTIDAKGGYDLSCTGAPRVTATLRWSGTFVTPHVDSDAWAAYEAAALAHLAQERKAHGHVPALAAAPPQAPVAFMLTAVVRDGRTFLVDFPARRAFCGEDAPGGAKEEGGRVFRKQDAKRPFGTPSEDYCADGWQPSP
jgi:hypothetical protein